MYMWCAFVLVLIGALNIPVATCAVRAHNARLELASMKTILPMNFEVNKINALKILQSKILVYCLQMQVNMTLV